MRNVPIESIRDGLVLGKTIYNSEGIPLLKSGAIITTGIRKKLRELNLDYIYVVDQYSKLEIKNIVKPDFKEKATKLIKETFNNVNRLNISSFNLSSNNTNNSTDDEYLKSIPLLAERLIEDILSNNNVLVSLVDIKSLDTYTYEHSLNVAIISLVMGISLKLNQEDLLNLCIGALLHDIGKVFIPNEITTKEGPLTYEEYEIMKTHPEKGYNYLKDKSFIHSHSRMIVLQHHERFDGFGYPNKLDSNKINTLARIVSIADVYDALTSNRSYRPALCASDALEYIMSNGCTMFDFNIVKVFSKVIVPFPFGTIVNLSNGDIGIVQETLPNFPLRPNIKILQSSDKEKNGTTINLIKELSVVISSIENNFTY